MFKRKWDWLLIPHVLIVLWAILFNLFCFVYEEGEIAELLAPGIIAGLFVSIPLAIVSLIARSKKRFGDKCSVPILALSIANLFVGIQSWLFLAAIMRMP